MHRFLSSKGVGASTATQELLLLPPLELQLTEILDCRITNAKCLPQEGEQQPSKASETRAFILSGRQAVLLSDYSLCPDYGFQRVGAELAAHSPGPMEVEVQYPRHALWMSV